MPDGGLLLTVPAQSVLIRLVLGSLAAAVGARLLLRAGLRVPRIRVGAALVPAAVVVAVLVVSFGHYRIPSLMVADGASGVVVLPIHDTYALVGPSTLPFIVGGWAILTTALIAWRTTRVSLVARRTRRAMQGQVVPSRVRRAVESISARMDLETPNVGMAPLDAGACVVGIRRPVLVFDPDLAEMLDNQELEGVVAHELAHIRRRDNLMAMLMSIVQDAVFFIPGGRWALRQLLVEREIAADQVATETTGRPAALAGGLLKVLGDGTTQTACASLLPRGTLVQRVEHLIDDRTAPTRRRTATELSGVVLAVALIVALSVGVPAVIAGADADGGVGVLLSAPDVAAPAVDQPVVEARVFGAYRASSLQSTPRGQGLVLDDRPAEVSASSLRACAVSAETCTAPTISPTLSLRPQPRLEVDATLGARWHAREMMEAGQLLRIYWLSSLR